MRFRASKLTAIIAVLLATIAPARADNAQPRKIYSGWIPYYAMKSSLPAALSNFDLIKEVMPFWYTFKYNGTKASITDLYTPANPNTPMVQPLSQMRAAGFTIIPTITDGTDKLVLANLLSTPAGRTMAVQVIDDLVTKNNFDGIDLDFEGFAFVDGSSSWDGTKPNWVAFVEQLSTALHADGKLLSITTPYLLDPASGKRGYYVYAWADIAPVIDRLRIMTYDYSVANPGPIGPIAWTDSTVKYAVSVMPASKVYVGLAGYGRDWVTKVDGVCPADVAKTIAPGAKAATFLMSNAQNLATGYNAAITYNDAFQEATFTYQKIYNGNTATGLSTSCTATRVAWYQDARAYQARAQLVSKYRLGGLVAWTIGFEDAQAMANIRSVALSIAPDQVISTLTADNLNLNYGQILNLTGIFTLPDKTPISSLPVHVEAKNGSDSAWREVTLLQSGSDGKVTLPILLGVNQSLRLRTDGTWERLEAVSTPSAITVKPLININAPLSASSNSTVTINGNILPAKGTDLTLETFDKSWKSVGTARSDGTFSFTQTVGSGPFIKFRVSGNGGVSQVVTIAIR